MIQYLYLGRVPYDEALRLQAEIAALRLAGSIPNVLLLLEHPPVLTLGRNAHRSNVLASDALLAARGVTIHEINRGGDVTYHGPGQLVGYPIFDLRSLRGPGGNRLGPVDFVRGMEEALIRLCAGFGVEAGRIKGLTGVWCGGSAGNRDQGTGNRDQGTGNSRPTGLPPAASFASCPARKIAAIGIHVSRGITSHGFAFNLTTNLRDFDLIVPCGIRDHAVTSLENELPPNVTPPTLEALAHLAAQQFGAVFNEPIAVVPSLSALRAEAGPASPPQFPAEDTPVQIPPELERLHSHAERPVRA
ncbi:MAG: lipoyl(octanoyl) transferase [Terracidiphilus sp.]